MDTTSIAKHETTDNKAGALKGALLLKAMQRIPYACLVVPGPGGRIRTKIEFLAGCGTVHEYAYDEDGRLAQVKRDGRVLEQYVYDEQGRRLMDWCPFRGVETRGHEYGPDNQLLRAGETSFEYDAMGRLTRRKEPGKQDFICMYTPLGLLGAARLPDMHWVSYDRDGDGRRTAKQIDRKKVEGYGWDKKGRLLWFFDDLARQTSWFEYADEQARLPEFMQRARKKYRLAWDHLGSLRAVIDGQGKVVKEIEYDAFGNILRETAPELRLPFGFAGGLHDRDTGLIRYRFRDYLPDIGRFTAKDPIGYKGGDSDLYGYCLDDPVNGIDPDGLKPLAPIGLNKTGGNGNAHKPGKDASTTLLIDASQPDGARIEAMAQAGLGGDETAQATPDQAVSLNPVQLNPVGHEADTLAEDTQTPTASSIPRASTVEETPLSETPQGHGVAGLTREDFAENTELAGQLGLEGEKLRDAFPEQTEQPEPLELNPEMREDVALREAREMPDDRWVPKEKMPVEALGPKKSNPRVPAYSWEDDSHRATMDVTEPLFEDRPVHGLSRADFERMGWSAKDVRTYIRFMDYITNLKVTRHEDQPFRAFRIADDWDDLPEIIRNFEPVDGYGQFVDDRGDHPVNQRFPGGYHLTSGDHGDEGVWLHFDAHDPLEGVSENMSYVLFEVGNETENRDVGNENYWGGKPTRYTE